MPQKGTGRQLNRLPANSQQFMQLQNRLEKRIATGEAKVEVRLHAGQLAGNANSFGMRLLLLIHKCNATSQILTLAALT